MPTSGAGCALYCADDLGYISEVDARGFSRPSACSRWRRQRPPAQPSMGLQFPALNTSLAEASRGNVDKVQAPATAQRSWFLSAPSRIVLVAAADLSNTAIRPPKQKTHDTSTIVIQVLTSMRFTPPRNFGWLR